MNGLMQNQELTITSLLEHAVAAYPRQRIVSILPEGGQVVHTYESLSRRIHRLAHGLKALGVKTGDRIATLAWNTHRHLELFYAVSGLGAVLHTVNPRLFFDQINFIIKKGNADLLFYDDSFTDIAQQLADQHSQVHTFVNLQGRTELTTSAIQLEYESLIQGHPEEYRWPQFSEATASSLCFTSGTTGNPKGVLYSHRSTVLHALVAAHDNGFGITVNDRVMPVSPMYHANAWAMPYICPLVGAEMVLPANKTDADELITLINKEKVTFAAAVPTIWKSVLDELDSTAGSVPSLQRTFIGGTAVPRSMIESFSEKYGVEVLQVWGMTETSPLGVACNTHPEVMTLPEKKRNKILREKQGRLQYGVKMRIVDEKNKPLPHDGETFGRLQVKGPWITSGYYGGEPNSALNDDWFETGDMGTLDPYGYLKITDRVKDVIKSGGGVDKLC